jgi:hypothetical protein
MKDPNKKKIGIVVDNYKLNKYLKKIDDKDFKDVDHKPFNNESTAIFVFVKNEAFNKAKSDIQKMCTELELHFKTRN